MSADEENDALIARLIWQQENAGYNTYGGNSDLCDSDDSDYGSTKRKRKPGSRVSKPKKTQASSEGAVGRKRKGSSQGAGAQDKENQGEVANDQGEGGKSATGRKKRKDTGAARQAGRAWSEEEETKFLEALQLFGRDWKQCAAHVGTRDTKQFTSHAQKHFIKQCLLGVPLPPKVAESGKGYTLSGKPLDPCSAAAAAYGFKVDILRRLPECKLHVALKGVDTVGLPEDLQAAAAASGTMPPASSAGTAAPARPDSSAAVGSKSEDADEAPCAVGTSAGAQAAPAPGASVSGKGSGSSDTAAADAAGNAGTCEVPPAAGVVKSEAAECQGTAAEQGAQAGAGDAQAPRPTSNSGPPAAPLSPAVPAPSNPPAPPPQPPTAPASAPKPPRAIKQRARNPPKPQALSPPSEPTEYARNRPRRERTSRLQLGETSESTDLVRCCEYSGVPGCGSSTAQPFSVEVAAQALLLMDFHSHLSGSEIIGMLGGTWDAAARKLLVGVAFPCRRAAGSDARTSVELDPGAQLEAAAAFEQQGMVPVGWYHSHPTFEPSPSQKDMDNQRNQQAYFRDSSCGAEPYIGVIVGPFDLALPSAHSVITAFNVQQRGPALIPYNIRYAITGEDELPEAETQDMLLTTVEMFREDVDRVDLTEMWRPFTNLQPGGVVEGAALTKMEKMKASLRRHLPGVEEGEAGEFVEQLCLQLKQQWNLS